ncbi:TetR/AcrR family transcriptional regulator C-terminal domain-containing protein [Frankia sp. AgB32]|uniref:TetR/AcrR family transcriptional regulator C-terminal domain-containing protein n=1 Tax=Frankia sp. AgB32 TaxID=631119 RepID=UPI00200F5D76|nr:TetR/AcrR family transcriptional regulator C-terminal domain-containing protein [Frankia sp. AgB32]MCK9896154.1 TetR/AcrR family transcriptional regulator C-terminal domain-containing protein [Frankia sp. AgB32]
MPEGKPRRRPGPAPKVSRAAIAEAGTAIGFDDVTVKKVAEYLGVSVAGLYHHVRGRDDLLRIGGELLLRRGEMPHAADRDWHEWLHEAAWYLRARLAEHPELIVQYVNGAMPWRAGLRHLEAALDVLVQAGFSPAEALAAFHAIARLAFGAAADHHRDQTLARQGAPSIVQIDEVFAADPDGLRRSRELIALLRIDPGDLFDQQVALLLEGIAAGRTRTADLGGIRPVDATREGRQQAVRLHRRPRRAQCRTGRHPRRRGTGVEWTRRAARPVENAAAADAVLTPALLRRLAEAAPRHARAGDRRSCAARGEARTAALPTTTALPAGSAQPQKILHSGTPPFYHPAVFCI